MYGTGYNQFKIDHGVNGRKMHMKKVLAMVCGVIILAAIAISGTIAYFTDSDSATNVFTMGNVVIKLNEQQRSENGGLENFEPNKDLMPLVGGITQVDDQGLPKADSFQDKIVTVTNTGKSDAYVRVYVGVPKELDDNGALHFVEGDNYNAKNNLLLTFGTPDKTVNQIVGGVAYNFYCFMLNDKLEPEATTGAAIVGFYLDSKVDYSDDDKHYYIGDKQLNDVTMNVEIPVYVQAVQAMDFDNAATAFAVAFEDKTPWGGTLPPTSTSSTTPTSVPSTTPTPAPTVITSTRPSINANNRCYISSAAELLGFAEAVNAGEEGYANNSALIVKLTNDIVLCKAQNWTPIGTGDYKFKGIFDGNHHTIYHMTIDDNSTSERLYAGLFGNLLGTVKNLKIANANIDITTAADYPHIGFIAGRLSGDRSKIEDCSVTDSELNFKSVSTKIFIDYGIGGIVGVIEGGDGGFELIDCSVSGCTITDSTDSSNHQAIVGGIAGMVWGNNNMLDDCKVSSCTLKSDGSSSLTLGGIVGTVELYNGPETPYRVILTDCKVEGGCKLYGTDATRTGTIVGDVDITLSDFWSCDETNTVSNDTKAYYRSGEDYTEITDPKPYN